MLRPNLDPFHCLTDPGNSEILYIRFNTPSSLLMETATPQFMQRNSSASISQAEVSRSNKCLVRHGKQTSRSGRQIFDIYGSYQAQIKSTTSARLSHSQRHAQKGNCQITQLECQPTYMEVGRVWHAGTKQRRNESFNFASKTK